MKVFGGELMTCVLCGRAQQSDPGRRSNWRAVVLDTRTYYACPGHFPPDGSDAEAFEAAYYRFLRRALETHRAAILAAHEQQGPSRA